MHAAIVFVCFSLACWWGWWAYEQMCECGYAVTVIIRLWMEILLFSCMSSTHIMCILSKSTLFCTKASAQHFDIFTSNEILRSAMLNELPVFLIVSLHYFLQKFLNIFTSKEIFSSAMLNRNILNHLFSWLPAMVKDCVLTRTCLLVLSLQTWSPNTVIAWLWLHSYSPKA
jgi:hypothetical protein